jgi:predicted RNA-binding Zn-ribbon protein involved in translation (DUF1610 family)
MSESLLMPEIQYRDWEIENDACCDLNNDDLGNCPNCAEVVVRELVYRGAQGHYYWPCPSCGFTHHGATIPALD